MNCRGRPMYVIIVSLRLPGCICEVKDSDSAPRLFFSVDSVNGRELVKACRPGSAPVPLPQRRWSPKSIRAGESRRYAVHVVWLSWG